MTVGQKEKAVITSEFRKEALRLMAKMLGQRFVYPSLEAAVGDLKNAFNEFEQGIAKAERADKEALLLIDAVGDQSRLIGEKETGKEFGAKLAVAYCDIVEFRKTL